MNKNYVFFGVVVVLVVIGAYFFTKSTQKPTDVLNNEGNVKLQNETPQPAEVTPGATADQKGDTTPLTINTKKYMNDADVKTLDIQVTQQGTGTAVSKKGDHLTMNYTGTLLNGKKFDSSIDRGIPFDFTIGAGMVIQGWEQGLLGMKVGEKRRLIIPSDMAYGPMGHPPVIPQNAALIFDVELLKIDSAK